MTQVGPEVANKGAGPRFSLGRAVRWLGVVALAIAVLTLVWWLSASTPQASESQTQVKSVLHLEPFVVNLADPDGKAYLRVGIDLGLKEEQTKDSAAMPTALIRDTLLGVLTTCSPNELLSAEGKAKLRQQLLEALQQRDPALGVQEVYFTEFLIQR